ncbi:MAG: hypothetical protein HW403_747 [Dehalococcoidia bacterium]|nr:hypothetical protein [Dehalococcoidia bacterium]
MSNIPWGWWLVPVLLIFTASSCQASPQAGSPVVATPSKPPDAANATYMIERQSVTLSNGSAEQSIVPGSATKMLTKLSDQQAVGDLNGDGKPDVAVVLVHDPGGSGTFYYIAAVLNDGTGKGNSTNVELLGDRIAVEKISIDKGEMVVDFLTRRSDDPRTAPPSVKTTKRFSVRDGKLAASQ